MSESRKKGAKNIMYGLLGQVITLALGLVIPRLILVNYGSETNGLINTATQIFAYVALLEAGVGGATLQALYKPLGANNKKSVSEILAATHVFYKRTGIFYLIAVIGVAFIYPLIINTELNYYIVFGIILFNGLGGAINYFFQGKYHILLQADGKNYVRSNLSTIVYTLSSISKLVLLYLRVNILILQFVYFLFNIAQMIFIMLYIKKHYSWINLKEKPDFNSISQRNSVLVHQLSALVFGNTDSIILSLFCGLKVVSVYSLIGMFIGQVNNLMNHISNGILFSLGQNFENNKQNFQRLYDMFEVLYFSLISFCLSIIYIFLNPFLALYTKDIADVEYVDKYLPALFVCSYFLTWARVPSIYVINNCAGHYSQTRPQTIIESIINILVSLVLVKPFGIYGVLLGTIIALLYRTNEMIIYSSKKILNRSIFTAYKRLLPNLLWLILFCLIFTQILPEINTYFELIIYCVGCALISGLGFVILNTIVNKNVAKNIIMFFRKTNKKNYI